MAKKKLSPEDLARERVSLLADYQKVFGSYEGKRVLWHMAKKFGILRSSATDDPYLTSFNEGQRAVILWLLNDRLKLDPNELYERLTEKESIE